MLTQLKEKIKWKVSEGLVDYETAVKFMEDEVQNIVQGTSNGTIWLTQHPQIYTAGISSTPQDLINTGSIPVIKTNRGGKYTYHGPGMRIIYVMVDIKQVFAPEKPDISKFVKMLENWVIDILEHFEIKGEIRKDRVGVWVKNKNSEDKIAAMGIKVKKWVSYHGIAINLNPDLSFFGGIVPCGIVQEGLGVTSMHKLGKTASLDELDAVIKYRFSEIRL
jgi:lipoyl(octanoyl) transferase